MSKVMMIVFSVLTVHYWLVDDFTSMIMCGLFAWLCEGVNSNA